MRPCPEEQNMKPFLPRILGNGSFSMTSNRRRSYAWGAGRVAFLLHRDAIQRALNQGHAMAVIHRAHAEALGIGYDQFVDYVAQYLERPTMGRSTRKRKAPEQLVTAERSGTLAREPPDPPRLTRPDKLSPSSPSTSISIPCRSIRRT